MEGAAAMVVNAYEVEIISEKTGWTIDQLRQAVGTLVITQGVRGAIVYHQQDTILIPSIEPLRIVDPTGAGDAFRAGLITGMSYGLELETSAKMGALCATFVLESNGPQGHTFTINDFLDRYAAVFRQSDGLEVLEI
jgi:adenosine kinase